MADMTTLQQSLINARKVMTKVDNGDFSKGNSNRTVSMGNVTDSSGLLSQSPNMVTQPTSQLPDVDMSSARKDLTPKSRMTESQIKNSKLPEAIKQAMIDNPIPDIPWNGGGVGLSENFLNGVKNEMDKQGMSVNQTKKPQQPSKTTNKTKKTIFPKSKKYYKGICKRNIR